MESEILIRKRREFGEIITDPFKLIFRNLKAIITFNLMYIFVPLAVGLGFFGYLQMSLVNISNFDTIPWLYGLIGLAALIISGLHTTASTYSIVKAAEEGGFENLTFDDINSNFKGIYKRNLVFFAITSAISILFFGLMIVIGMAMPVFMAIMMIFLLIAVFFYIGPLLYLAMSIFLYNKEVGYAESFGKSRSYMNEHWGAVFGTFAVSGLINGMLQYTFTIPFLLIFFMMNDVSTMLDNPTTFTAINLVQNTVVAFLSSFMVQYIGMCMYFKYFDLFERKFGRNLIQEIEGIGEQKSDYFDNEGEY